jgi:hypothetical protein
MRTVAAAAATSLVLVAGVYAQDVPSGSSIVTATPVFHQIVMFSLPPEFKSQKATYENNSGAFYIREHVPEGENVAHWTQMITLTAARDLASNPDATPRAFVARLASGFQRHCPDSFATSELGPENAGSYQGFAVIASCGHVQGGSQAYSESAIILALKGSADYYTLQWAHRGPDEHGPMKLDPGYWTKQFDRLRPIKLCAIAPGEAPPYPSCIGR